MLRSSKQISNDCAQVVPCKDADPEKLVHKLEICGQGKYKVEVGAYESNPFFHHSKAKRSSD